MSDLKAEPLISHDNVFPIYTPVHVYWGRAYIHKVKMITIKH